MGFLYGDYGKISFSDKPNHYIIGTNSGEKFISESTVLLASKDCLIKLNGDKHWEPVYWDDYWHKERKIWKIEVKRVSEDGELEIWAEGDIITDT